MDAVLTAIGQDPRLDDLGATLRRSGPLLWMDAQGQTSDARIWAGGDLSQHGALFASPKRWAWASARTRHRQVARARRRRPCGGRCAQREPVVPLSAISLHYHPQQARAASPRRPAAERMADQDEVQLWLDVAKALAEAQRCFPAAAASTATSASSTAPIWRCSASAGLRVNTDYRKGCGVCVRNA